MTYRSTDREDSFVDEYPPFNGVFEGLEFTLVRRDAGRDGQ